MNINYENSQKTKIYVKKIRLNGLPKWWKIFTWNIYLLLKYFVSIIMFSTGIFTTNGFYSAYILKIFKAQEIISKQFNQIFDGNAYILVTEYINKNTDSYLNFSQFLDKLISKFRIYIYLLLTLLCFIIGSLLFRCHLLKILFCMWCAEQGC